MVQSDSPFPPTGDSKIDEIRCLMNHVSDLEKQQPFTLNLTAVKTARWFWMPTVLFIVTRLGVALVAYLAIPLIADNTNPAPYHLRPPENLVLDALGSRWDTGFYISIVEEGYKLENVQFPSVPFFPLLPLLMRAIIPLTGDALTAGVIVSNVAMWMAAILFYCLVKEMLDEKVADRAVFYLLIFPTAFFGAAIYTESLFLLTTIGAYLMARRGHWWGAALFGIAATLTRFVGLIVVPLLALEWWRQWRDFGEDQRPLLTTAIAPMMAPLGTLSYMVYLQRAFGDPFAFIAGSAAWGRMPQSPLATVAQLLQKPAQGWWTAVSAGHIHLDNWIDFLFVLFFLSMGIVLLLKKRWAEAAFVLLGVFIPFNSGLLMSQRRYMWVLFPVFIQLAQWGRHSWVDRTITTTFLMGLALFTAMFANMYWVA